MSSIRNKQGPLQMCKGKKWKTYLFKVTGSTYLHYFDENKTTEPKDQVFLTAVSSVEIPPKAPKHGNYVFEVRHSGKNSPWVLSASSEEERHSWMETIKPNSTVALHSSQIKDLHERSKSLHGDQMHQMLASGQYNGMAGSRSPNMRTSQPNLATPPNQYQRPSEPNLQMPQPRPPGNMPHPQGTVPYPMPYPQGTMPQPHPMPHPHNGYSGQHNVSMSLGGVAGGGDTRQFMTQSLGSTISLSPTSPAPLTPLSPSEQQHPSSPIPHPSSPKPHPPQRVISVSDRPPMPEPRQLVMAQPPAEYLDPKQLNMPPGQHEEEAKDDNGSNDLSNGDHSANSYLLISPPSKKKPYLEDVCLIRKQDTCSINPPPGFTPPVSPPPKDSTDGVFETLREQFTTSQISALVEMLTKMTAKEEDKSKSIGYLVTKTADCLTDSMLVTDDDDPDTYNARPEWAKAIHEQVQDHSESSFSDLHAVHIAKTSLMNMNKIGAGHFGDVYSADYCPDGFNPEDAIKVAVKTAKKSCTEQQRKDILREISVMTNIVHPNLVRLYGINQEETEGLPWLVLEYMPHGDLKHYLKESPKKSTETLIKFMVDVAMGMHYIAERGLIHRDLAARNVLVGDGEICKVADFGLLRELPEDDAIYVSSSNVPCPIRWMPPEAITRRKFSVASDVWSFGILQWEMINPGKLPYSNFGNFEVVSKISEGYRMPTPRGCPPVVSRIMRSCWHADPAKRPSFLLITTLLTAKFTTQANTSKPGHVEATPTSNRARNIYM